MTKAQLELLMAVAERVRRGEAAAGPGNGWPLTDLLTTVRREHADTKQHVERITALETELAYYKEIAAELASRPTQQRDWERPTA